MSTRATFILLSAVALVAVAWWAWPSAGEAGMSPLEGPATSTGLAGQGATAAAGHGGGARSPAGGNLSDATGLTMDAARLFELGFAGGLSLDRDTRASIEALINNMPLEPSAQDMERLQATLRAGLPYAEAEKAYKLIADYRSYSRDVQREMMPLGIPKTQQEAMVLYDRMDTLKRRYFDESTSNALFGTDERFARLTMEAGFIQQDTALSAEQKVQAIEALRARLPADRRELIPPFDPSLQAADPAAPASSSAAQPTS